MAYLLRKQMKYFNYEKSVVITYVTHLNQLFKRFIVLKMAAGFVSYLGLEIWKLIPLVIQRINFLWISESNKK